MANTLHNSTYFSFRSDPERRELFAKGHFFTGLASFDSVKCYIRQVLKCVLARVCAVATAVRDAASKTDDDSIGRVGLSRLRQQTSARLDVLQTRLNPLILPAIFEDVRLQSSSHQASNVRHPWPESFYPN